MKGVIWTPLALDSLKEIIEFLESRWTDQIVENFLNQIDFRIQQIQESPKLAPVIEQTHYHQLLIHETTTLFYRDYTEYIKILLIWDNRQNPSKLLEKLRASNS